MEKNTNEVAAVTNFKSSINKDINIKVGCFGVGVLDTVTEEKINKRVLNMNTNKLKRLCRECIGDFWSRVDNNEIPISNFFTQFNSSVTVSSTTESTTNTVIPGTKDTSTMGTMGTNTTTNTTNTTDNKGINSTIRGSKGVGCCGPDTVTQKNPNEFASVTKSGESGKNTGVGGVGVGGGVSGVGVSGVPVTVTENNNIITMSVSDYSYKSTPFGDVYYSPRFQDEKYIYRYVILTKGVRNEAYRLLKQSKSYLLTEHQIIRELCIDLSPGWEHFMLFKNRLDELILRRKL